MASAGSTIRCSRKEFTLDEARADGQSQSRVLDVLALGRWGGLTLPIDSWPAIDLGRDVSTARHSPSCWSPWVRAAQAQWVAPPPITSA